MKNTQKPDTNKLYIPQNPFSISLLEDYKKQHGEEPKKDFLKPYLKEFRAKAASIKEQAKKSSKRWERRFFIRQLANAAYELEERIIEETGSSKK
ncbi:MAG: hypothetical protein U9Q15_03765 [Patescibacteria group bacterium]|nr:hypothetical protein [Patescibacteria group bacterium]